MSYNSAIPQANDPRALSQRQILSNFQSINSIFGANHTLLTGSNELLGQHTVLTMQPVTLPVTAIGQISLYNALVGGIPELFFAPQDGATPIQLTYPSVGVTASPFRFHSFVAGPFVVYGGYVTNPSNGLVITLSPATTLIYVGLNEASSNPNNAQRFSTATNLNSGGNGKFTINYVVGGTPTINLYFLAIGKP